VFGDLGAPELLIILAIVVLLFAVGKLGRLGRDLGTSVREFRRAVADDDKPEPTTDQQAVATQQVTAPATLTEPTAAAASESSAPAQRSGLLF